MIINENILFGQLTLPEPEPTIDASSLKLNRGLAGFLAGYSGTTLDAYRLDLRQWIDWLATFHTDPFAVERAHIELYARTAEQEGRARSTIGRRLSTICGFYRYCEQERLIERNPGAHIRRPNRTTNRPSSDSIGTNSVPSLSRPDSPAGAITPWNHAPGSPSPSRTGSPVRGSRR